MKTTFPKFDEALVKDIEDHLDQNYLTMIEYEQTMDGTDGELNVTFANGRGMKSYARPMFQIIPRDAFSGMGPSVRPCPSCDRWDRSWKCEQHTERKWDTDLKVWENPDAAHNRTVLEQMAAYIEAAVQGREAQGAGPHGERRFGYVYDLRADRWVPDAVPSALIERRVRAINFQRDDGDSVADFRRSFFGLPDRTIQFHGSFGSIRVEGETLQGVGNFFEIEVEPNDDTAA